MRALYTFASVMIVAPMSAFAHSGHGRSPSDSAGATATHYLTEPVHAVAIGAVLLCIAVVVAARHLMVKRANDSNIG